MNGKQDDIKNYGAAEILRYLSGKMSRQENHAFERASLDDDLLADAIEGYRIMRETMDDDTILNTVSQVSQKQIQKEKAKAAIISFARFRWVGYTAAACIVLAAGWWVFNLTQPSNLLPSENSGSEKQATELVQSPEGEENTDVVKLTDEKKEDQARTADKPENTPPKKANEIIKEKKESTTISQDLAIVDPEKQQAINPRAMKAQADEVNRIETRKIPADSTVNLLQAKTAGLAEANSSRVLRILEADTTDAIPVGSWDAYLQFLKRQIAPPPPDSTAKAFITITGDGKFETIKVEGGYSTTECKAIEKIIQSGPSWKSKTANKARAIVEWQ